MASRRRDPRVRRPINRTLSFNDTKQKRSGFRYVLVNKGDPQSMRKYRSLGYKVVRWDFKTDPKDKDKFLVDEDGVKIPKNPYTAGALLGDEEQGKPVECQGDILMEIPIAAYKEIVENGHEADHSGGQSEADEREQYLIRQTGQTDLMRGITGARLRNATLDGRGNGHVERVTKEADL